MSPLGRKGAWRVACKADAHHRHATLRLAAVASVVTELYPKAVDAVGQACYPPCERLF